VHPAVFPLPASGRWTPLPVTISQARSEKGGRFGASNSPKCATGDRTGRQERRSLGHDGGESGGASSEVNESSQWVLTRNRDETQRDSLFDIEDPSGNEMGWCQVLASETQVTGERQHL
jgi:hypothetical protein